MLSRLSLLAASCRALPRVAREINFPPVAAAGFRGQHALSADDDIDISTGSAFAGLTTYANLPYVHCLEDEGAKAEKEKFDIAILGAPFDTVGFTFVSTDVGVDGRPINHVEF